MFKKRVMDPLRVSAHPAAALFWTAVSRCVPDMTRGFVPGSRPPVHSLPPAMRGAGAVRRKR